MFCFNICNFWRSVLRLFRGGGCSDALGHLVGRLPWLVRSDAYRRSDVGTTIRGGGRSVLASGCRGRSALMLADVQTWGATFRGGGVLGALGILSGGCRGRSVLMLADVQTWAQPFGRWL